MSFPNYPLSPISSDISEAINKRIKQIRDHSANLVEAGIVAETERIVDLVPKAVEQVMIYLENNNVDLYPVTHKHADDITDRLSEVMFSVFRY